jgi:chromate transporter
VTGTERVPEPGPVRLREIVREWGRIGCTGFGGPPTHIALLRRLCVNDRRWMGATDFEDAVAACNLLPGPASTQLAIYCAWRLRGRVGALVGGAGFILPGFALILALSALFLSGSPPLWVKGASAGAGAAVAAVAVQAGSSLVPASWRRMRGSGRARWVVYLVAGGTAAATLGPWLVLVLLGCGAVELLAKQLVRRDPPLTSLAPVFLLGTAVAVGGLASLVWVAFKVGALSYGGGFVIIPIMQADVVHHYHWMTNGGFLNAVALGQITPGPVVLTVAVVGYAVAGVGGAALATIVAFSPSFAFILLGGSRFDRLRRDVRARTFLDGAGPAAIGAIFGAAIPLARALAEPWQFAVLGGAAVLLLAVRRGVVLTLLAAAGVGILVAVAGGPLPR